jgi:outer membrane protein
VTAALYGVDVAQLQVKIAEGALWPTLGLQGSIQQQTFPNILAQNLFTATGQLNLSVPIYQGSAEYSAIRLDKQNVGQQRLNAQHRSKAVDASRRALNFPTGRYEHGISDT